MEKPVAEDKPETMVTPTGLPTTTNPLLTSDWARRNLLREYKDSQIFHMIFENQSVLRCRVSRKLSLQDGTFLTIDEAELAKLDCPGSCREYTFPRDDDLSKAKGWIRGNTEFGPVLKVTINYQ